MLYIAGIIIAVLLVVGIFKVFDRHDEAPAPPMDESLAVYGSYRVNIVTHGCGFTASTWGRGASLQEAKARAERDITPAARRLPREVTVDRIMF